MIIDIQNIDFSYNKESLLFSNFSTSIQKGKITAIIGESGCGKSTLISLIYGLFRLNAGQILFDGKKILGPIKNIVPGEKDMKMVAQNFDLTPFANVFENVGKYLSNTSLEIKQTKVNELLEIVGMQEFALMKPKFLSGGQQQRVAIARSLSVLPKLLLLDEPFSHLDFSRKISMRERFFDYVKEKNISLIISTHNIIEILPWVDEIIVMKDAKIVQQANAHEVNKNPVNEYVASLFGEVNVLSEEEMSALKLPKKFYFPHQIVLSDNHAFDATVLESRFAGNYFRTKILIDKNHYIMYSSSQLNGDISVQFRPV